MKVYKQGDYTDPSTNLDVLIDVWKGFVKAELLAAFKKSSENCVAITRKPSLGVHATRAIKADALQLVALTPTVIMDVGGESTPANTVQIEGAPFDYGGKPVRVHLKSVMQFPQDRSASRKVPSDPYIVAYWCIRESFDPAQANATREYCTSSVKSGLGSFEIRIPVVVNTKALVDGDEIIILKQTPTRADKGADPEVGDDDAGSPKTKLAKTGRGKGKAKAKGAKGGKGGKGGR